MTTTPAGSGRTPSGEPVYDAEVRETTVPVENRDTIHDDVVVSDDRPLGDDVVRDDVVREEVVREEVVPADEVVEDDRTLRQEVVEREREEFGGFKFGSAFFGWLTATGTAVLLIALVGALGTALGLGVTEDTSAEDVGTIGIAGAIALVVVLFIAYFAGGYVAGRMARFSGIKQGIGVWLWAVLIAVVVAIVGAIGGSRFNILANLNTFPRIPVNEGDLTLAGIVTAVVVAGITLLAAILGGVAGMRYHRRVDRVGLGR
jgi:hypothetical protein